MCQAWSWSCVCSQLFSSFPLRRPLSSASSLLRRAVPPPSILHPQDQLQDLVYLTADSPDELTELDPSKVCCPLLK